MILTDKAKEDFLIRIYYQEDTNQASDETIKEKVLFHAEKWFEKQDRRFKNALIIEWLDSVGLCITILVCVDLKFDAYITAKEKRKEVSQFNESREIATMSSIKKANEIYNSL